MFIHGITPRPVEAAMAWQTTRAQMEKSPPAADTPAGSTPQSSRVPRYTVATWKRGNQRRSQRRDKCAVTCVNPEAVQPDGLSSVEADT